MISKEGPRRKNTLSYWIQLFQGSPSEENREENLHPLNLPSGSGMGLSLYLPLASLPGD